MICKYTNKIAEDGVVEVVMSMSHSQIHTTQKWLVIGYLHNFALHFKIANASKSVSDIRYIKSTSGLH